MRFAKLTLFSIITIFSACAFVKEIGSSFDTYKPIAVNGKLSQSDVIARARIYAKTLGKTNPSDSASDFVKYDDFVYRRVNVVYSCALAFADIRDTIKVGLRKCKALDVDPKTKTTKWLDYGIDAPNSHRQAITDHFWYSMIDTAHPRKDSIIQSIDVIRPMSAEDLDAYIQLHMR